MTILVVFLSYKQPQVLIQMADFKTRPQQPAIIAVSLGSTSLQNLYSTWMTLKRVDCFKSILSAVITSNFSMRPARVLNHQNHPKRDPIPPFPTKHQLKSNQNVDHGWLPSVLWLVCQLLKRVWSCDRFPCLHVLKLTHTQAPALQFSINSLLFQSQSLTIDMRAFSGSVANPGAKSFLWSLDKPP